MAFNQVNALEFNEIKAQIKEFLRSQDQFSDYDFEGSSLTVLIDTLAYNTYYTAVNANLAVNEGFLETAVLRENVVKLARMLGYTPKSVSMRKEGEEWVDARGRRWEIKDGKRKQITKIPPRGFDKCDDCDKMILKDIDQDTFNRMSRCYHCQLEFEANLHREGKWQDWVKEMETKRWEGVQQGRK